MFRLGARCTEAGTRGTGAWARFADGTEIEEAMGLALKIVDLAPLALATMKRFVNDHVLPKGPAELAAGFGAELAAVRNSADAVEGVLAFKEKRKPRYQGR